MSPVGAIAGKLVSIAPPVEAAAGLGADVADLPIGALGPCGAVATGESCHGVELGGMIGHCTCVNLSETATLIELKQLLADVTGVAVTPVSVWTAANSALLVQWADAASGLFFPDVRRWWASGYVRVSDLVQRTASNGVYPTGAGILALCDQAGLLVETPEGLRPGPDAELFPHIGAALARFYSIVHPNAEEGMAVYPPVLGEAAGQEPAPLEPGGTPLLVPQVRLSLGRSPALQWLVAAACAAAGAGVAIAALRSPWLRTL